MIQDVAEKNGNMNVDVVTGALERSTKRIMGPNYMKAGMGDGGSCHPRDNIALKYLAKKLDLGYDLFGSIMESREVQARNIGKKLYDLSTYHQLPIIILGESYKNNVDITTENIEVIENIVPFRIEGRFNCMFHDDEGFVDGNWKKGETTARNEKRFVSEMQQNKINYKEDGMSNLNYELVNIEMFTDNCKLINVKL